MSRNLVFVCGIISLLCCSNHLMADPRGGVHRYTQILPLDTQIESPYHQHPHIPDQNRKNRTRNSLLAVGALVVFGARFIGSLTSGNHLQPRSLSQGQSPSSSISQTFRPTSHTTSQTFRPTSPTTTQTFHPSDGERSLAPVSLPIVEFGQVRGVYFSGIFLEEIFNNDKHARDKSTDVFVMPAGYTPLQFVEMLAAEIAASGINTIHLSTWTPDKGPLWDCQACSQLGIPVPNPLPMGDIIKIFESHGLKTVAFMEAGLFAGWPQYKTTGEANKANPVMMRSDRLQQLNGAVQIGALGEHDRDEVGGSMAFFSPSHPDVLPGQIDIYQEFLTRFRVYGVILDRMRFTFRSGKPRQAFVHNPHDVARIEQIMAEHGVSAHQAIQELITGYVNGLIAGIKEVQPDIWIAAAPLGYPIIADIGQRDMANWNVDAYLLQIYDTSEQSFRHHLRNYISLAKPEPGKRGFLDRFGVSLDTTKPDSTGASLQRKIEIIIEELAQEGYTIDPYDKTKEFIELTLGLFSYHDYRSKDGIPEVQKQMDFLGEHYWEEVGNSLQVTQTYPSNEPPLIPHGNLQSRPLEQRGSSVNPNESRPKLRLPNRPQKKNQPDEVRQLRMPD